VPRRAQVLLKDEPVGVLEETAAGGTRFTYHPDWQAPIACCFPVTRREHEWPAGLHPFFEHLAPEGWLREHQARSAHIEEQDDFGLLVRYGQDCIGAVGIQPHEGDPPPAPVTEVTANPGRTLSGVQRKLLVTRGADGHFTPAGATGHAPFIAKFNSERHPDLVRNEALSLRWAAAVLGRGEVNAATLAHVAVVNEAALIVTRFDRTPEGAKLRLEDFAQVLCKPRGRDYSGKYDASYEEAAAVVAEHSARPEIDRLRFFRRLVVFALLGNCDAHLKNFSLLETPQGLRLSPAYDIVNTTLYDRYDQLFGLSLGGEQRQVGALTRADFEAFGRAIGLPERAVRTAFAGLRRTVAAAREHITPPPGEPPDGFIHRYAEIVNNACLRILEN
jgi:serine/threonine-protein kinase HipA